MVFLAANEEVRIMPRHFTSEEKIEIEEKLLAAAKELFIQYGVSKTNISDITDRAGVGKGTFYHFYKSKGDIYMRLYWDDWNIIHDSIDQQYMGRKGKLENLILDYIYENRRQLFEHPIIAGTYERDALALISDKATKSRLESFADHAKRRLIAIINSWIEVNNIDCGVSPEVLSGMMRSISYLTYHKDEVGEDIFSEVIKKFALGISLVAVSKSEG